MYDWRRMLRSVDDFPPSFFIKPVSAQTLRFKISNSRISHFSLNLPSQMVVVAQLVRALDCGSRGRGFEPRHPPIFFFSEVFLVFYLFLLLTSF
jgi:hypothetical protein